MAEAPVFFANPAEWRGWLEANHEREKELLVGFHKTGSGLPSMTWPESVREALCFGWIDGIRRRIDEKSYSIRFTPRKARSVWSVVNMKIVAELMAADAMHPAGLKAFEARQEERSGIYAFEKKNAALAEEQEALFRQNAKAWKYFMMQPPWYRRTATWWVISAKKEETRLKRLRVLIDDCAADRTLKQLTR